MDTPKILTIAAAAVVAALLLIAAILGSSGDDWQAQLEVGTPSPTTSDGATPDVPPDVPPSVPWTGTEALQDIEDFNFAVVSDRTGGHRKGIFPMAMDKLNLVQPAFVVSVGDLIEGYTDNPQVLEQEWTELQQFVGKLEMPFFYVPGNHDMSNEVMAETWQQKFGPSYYHFRYRDVLFLALNSELFGMVHNPREPLPGPWQLDEQMAWAEQVLADNPDARWTFVLVHQPLWDWPQVHPQWERMQALLADRPHTVFAGHLHQYTLHRRNDSNYITLATTGGGSDLRGPDRGEFDQVALVQMRKDGPIIANVDISGIYPVDVRTESDRRLTRTMSKSITVEPAVQPEYYFDEGTANFKIKNSSSVPMAVEASFAAPSGYRINPQQRTAVLQPGTEEAMEVNLEPDSRGVPNIGAMPPLRAEFDLRSENAENGKLLNIKLDRSWVPDYPFKVGRVARSIEVDGDLSDWATPRFQVDDPVYVSNRGDYRGSEDLSFDFDLRADDNFLYAMINVRDDSLVSSRALIARMQDMVGLIIDVRGEPDLSRNYSSLEMAAATGELGKLILPFMTVGKAKPDPLLASYGIRPVSGLNYAGKQAPDGYTIEMAIPMTTLSDLAGGEIPERIRCNLIITDFDAGDDTETQVSWRTPRYSEGSVIGSGIFQLR